MRPAHCLRVWVPRECMRPRPAALCAVLSQLDHHCPWTGKCIGKRNLWMFYAFLVTTCASIAFVPVAMLIHVGGTQTGALAVGKG